MHSLDRHLASNVCCRKENSFQDRHCIGHDASASANNSNSAKQGNIFWKIQMKILLNRHHYSLYGNRKCRFYVSNKNSAGREWGVYVLVVLREGGWTTLAKHGGGSLRPRLWGERRPCVPFGHCFSCNDDRLSLIVRHQINEFSGSIMLPKICLGAPL